MKRSPISRLGITTGLCLLLAGCAGMMDFRAGKSLLAEGQVEQSLEKFHLASLAAPGNAEYRATWLATRDRAIAGWLSQADALRGSARSAEAESLYQRVLGLDAGNARAQAGLDELTRQARHSELLQKAKDAWDKKDGESALRLLRHVLAEAPRQREAQKLRREIEDQSAKPVIDPKLSAALKKPISIEFRDTPIKQVFEVFARTSGLNFIFDRDVRNDQRSTVFLRNTTVADAVNLVLLTNQLEQRVLDANSILIYPNTPAKAREYQALTVRAFYLNNADVKTVSNVLKAIVKTRDLVVDDKQNMIIMRDTPEAVRLAERLVALHDLPEPEVMLEVEILEVSRTRLLELGIQWPNQLSLTPLSRSVTTQTSAPTVTGTTTAVTPVTTTSAAPSSTNLTLDDLRGLTRSTLGVNISPLVINANKQDSFANLLANPRIRSRNREKAQIKVGDRVPNISIVSTPLSGTTSENITYIDVGLKLEVEPTIYMDDEVAIKVGLEVSNIVSQIQTKSGSLAYQIGTRNATAALRLRDGENQVLAGLINDEDRNSGAKIPALGDLPILGRLFGSQRNDGKKTEIVLSITPHIIRNPLRPALTEAEFDSGTEASIKNRSFEGSTLSPAFVPAPAPAAAPQAPAVAPQAPAAAPTALPAPAPPTPVPALEATGGATSAAAAPPTSATPFGTAPSDSPAQFATIPATIPAAAAPVGSSAVDSPSVTTLPPPAAGSEPAPAAEVTGSTHFSIQGPTGVKLGSSLQVAIVVQPNQPLSGIPFTLGYDPKVFEVLAVSEGDLMRQGGVSASFSSRVDAASGRVYGSAARAANVPGASASGTLVTLTLRALANSAGTPVQLLQSTPLTPLAGGSVAVQMPAPLSVSVSP